MDILRGFPEPDGRQRDAVNLSGWRTARVGRSRSCRHGRFVAGRKQFIGRRPKKSSTQPLPSGEKELSLMS